MKRILSMGEPMAEFAATARGPLREATSFTRGFGGDTSNYAVGVARLGGRAAYLCRLGDDEFGQALMAMWAREGVDTSLVRVVPGAYTAVYFISWRPDGSHDFSYIRRHSAASTLCPEDVCARVFQDVGVFHTSGITQAISASACDASFAAMALAREAGALVSYDPNVRLKLWPLARAKAIVLESVRQADIVFPNIEEARWVTGLEDPDANLDFFLGAGASTVALKLGAEGCLVGTARGQRFRLPAVPVDVVDTGGAGDAFDAAFAVSLMSGDGIEEAARFAVAAAALTTTRVGCTEAIPHRAEVVELMAERSVQRSPTR